jgi:hypothetical protein
MVENQDRNVGRILAKLRQLNLENDTIVVYLSDNGPNGHRWTGGMKASKAPPTRAASGPRCSSAGRADQRGHAGEAHRRRHRPRSDLARPRRREACRRQAPRRPRPFPAHQQRPRARTGFLLVFSRPGAARSACAPRRIAWTTPATSTTWSPTRDRPPRFNPSNPNSRRSRRRCVQVASGDGHRRAGGSGKGQAKGANGPGNAESTPRPIAVG